ncbi:MAG: DUF1800 domain-containing protein [Planctomycetota bacterium]|nr:DUF1800 domain-containing protein [Planctomycetota bacterium]
MSVDERTNVVKLMNNLEASPERTGSESSPAQPRRSRSDATQRPSASRDRLSRRALFASVAGLASGWAQSTARAVPSAVAADVDPGALINKLVRRVTMGFTTAELQLAQSLGYQGYLEYHLNPGAINDSAVDAMVAPLTTLTQTPSQIRSLPTGVIIAELTQATILRAVFSKRQLFERMVEFWTDHFNIDINNNEDRYLKTTDDRVVIRGHALGNFANLLFASAQSPAMLYYLDNHVSTAGNPNENYARELMELHTMGVDGGYTQQDVEEVARCFTGWSAFLRSTDPNYGVFRFDATRHDNGQKTVLGNIIPAGGGIADGYRVLNILIDHPSTSRFIARKLCRWLLSETPPTSVVEAVAATYRATRGDIKAMIRTALNPNDLANAAPKYKRPFHHAISGMRPLLTTITTVATFRQNYLNASGHHPFFWATPDGYPDRLEYWVGLVLPRWNFGAQVVGNQINGIRVDINDFFRGALTASQMIERINAGFFGGEMPVAQRDRILQHLLPDPPSTLRQQEAVGLAIGSPEFQWY